MSLCSLNVARVEILRVDEGTMARVNSPDGGVAVSTKVAHTRMPRRLPLLIKAGSAFPNWGPGNAIVGKGFYCMLGTCKHWIAAHSFAGRKDKRGS